MKKTLIIAAAVVAPVTLLGLGLWHFVVVPSPQYALYRTAAAAQNHDYATFSTYVNVDDVVSNAYDTSVAATQAKDASANTSWTQGFATLFKPTVVPMMRDALKKEVETGTFPSAGLTNLVAAYQRTSVQYAGKVATVTITDKNKKKTSVKLRDLGGHWQVFALELDTSALLAKSAPSGGSNVAANQTARFGQRMSLGAGWYLTIDTPAAYVSSDVYAQPADGKKWLTVQALYENTTATADSYSLSNLQLKDAQGHSFSPTYFGGKDPALNGDTIEAHGKATGFITYEVPADAVAQSVVYANSTTTIVFAQ